MFKGGILALTALIHGQPATSDRRRGLDIVALGLYAACLLYGDGMITPPISILFNLPPERVMVRWEG
jgi:KUP system potassium uptake protein